MKKYYLLDDWVLDGYRDMRRIFPKPRPVRSAPIMEEVCPTGILKEPLTGEYRSWKEGLYRGKKKNEVTEVLCFAKSSDGIHWQKSPHPGPRDSRYPDRVDFIGFEKKLGHSIYYDTHDHNPARRYKSVSEDGYIRTSPDGFHWKIDRAMRCFSHLTDSYSDCINNLIWNPVSGKYQITCRPIMADRRIALVQSEDLYHWSAPLVILQPDARDAPLTQFYGMPQYWAGDLLVGFLQKFRVPHEERRWEHKMYGFVESELVYSYNGLHWLRPDRTSFFEHPEPPELGSNSIYGGNIIDEGNHYLIYSTGYVMHDGSVDDYVIEGQPYAGVLVHTLRKDGFACMETIGGGGSMWTRSLQLLDDDFTINYQAVNKNSKIHLQLLGNDWKPLAGFTFDDFIPLAGDEIAGRPAWKGKNIAEQVGKVCKIEFKLFDARIYSFSLNSNIIYGPSLAKDLIEQAFTRKGRVLMRPDN